MGLSAITRAWNSIITASTAHMEQDECGAPEKMTGCKVLTVDTPDGDCIIVCEDDGNGISPEEKEKIFDRGFGKNTGLGLFLSREILAITGITINETGESGKGARFEMVVPKGMYR